MSSVLSLSEHLITATIIAKSTTDIVILHSLIHVAHYCGEQPRYLDSFDFVSHCFPLAILLMSREKHRMYENSCCRERN